MNFCEHFHLRWWIRQNIVSEDEEYQFNILKEVAININFARDISLDLSLKGSLDLSLKSYFAFCYNELFSILGWKITDTVISYVLYAYIRQ